MNHLSLKYATKISSAVNNSQNISIFNSALNRNFTMQYSVISKSFKLTILDKKRYKTTKFNKKEDKKEEKEIIQKGSNARFLNIVQNLCENPTINSELLDDDTIKSIIPPKEMINDDLNLKDLQSKF